MVFKRHDSEFTRKGLLGGQKGVILPLSLIFLLILCFMGIAAIMTSSSTSNMFGGMKRSDEALYLAEAGTEAAKRLISQSNPNFRQIYLDDGKLPGLANPVTMGNGTYMVRVLNNEDDPCFDTNDECDGQYLIRATGVVADTVKTLEVVVEAFSRFFYFTEVEEAPGAWKDSNKPPEERYVYFKDGDVMDGPVHTNGNPDPNSIPAANEYGFHFAGNNPGPIFRDTVSANRPPESMVGATPSFLKGTNWGRYVNLPVGPDRTFGTADDLMDVFEGAMPNGRIDTFNDPNKPAAQRPDPYAPAGTATAFRVHFAAGQNGGNGDRVIIWRYVYTDACKTDMVWTKHADLSISEGFNGVLYFYGGGTIYVGGKISETDGTLDVSANAESNSWVRGRWTLASGLSPGDANPQNLTPKDSDRGVAVAGPLVIQGDILYVGNYTYNVLNPSGKNIFPIVLDKDGNETVKTDPPDNLLGLVSANNITISYTDVGKNIDIKPADPATGCPAVTSVPAAAPIQPIIQNGIIIHGSLMATNGEQLGSFKVDELFQSSTKMTPGNPIYLFGGLIQYCRGVVGKFHADGTVTGGFSKKYRYDKRLLYMTPPHFPVAVNLKMRSWRE